MLDTDTVSYALRGHRTVVDRLEQEDRLRLCVSSITVAELRFGADKRGSKKLHHMIDTWVRAIVVESFDERAAGLYGRLGSRLATLGRPIGDLDTLIAAHAISVGAILVTDNTRHFERIDELRLENWI